MVDISMRSVGRVDASAADQLDAACEAGLEPFNAALNGWRAAQAAGGDVEMPEWLPQLRCLVQAGVPRVCIASDGLSMLRKSAAHSVSLSYCSLLWKCKLSVIVITLATAS